MAAGNSAVTDPLRLGNRCVTPAEHDRVLRSIEAFARCQFVTGARGCGVQGPLSWLHPTTSVRPCPSGVEPVGA